MMNVFSTLTSIHPSSQTKGPEFLVSLTVVIQGQKFISKNQHSIWIDISLLAMVYYKSGLLEWGLDTIPMSRRKEETNRWG